MITEGELAELVGHRLPGGRVRIEPYLDWLVRDVVRAPQRAPGEDAVHPAVAFPVAQGNVGLELEEVFALFGARSQDGPMLGEWSVDLARPLRCDLVYDVRCRVERVTRKRGARTGVFDLATVEIGLDGPDGVRHATVRPTYVLPRRGEPDDVAGSGDRPAAGEPVRRAPAAGHPQGPTPTAPTAPPAATPPPTAPPPTAPTSPAAASTGVRSGDVAPVREGDALPELVVESVDAQRCTTMAALLRDPNMIHLDPAETARLGLGDRVVNQGPTNLGYVQTMLAAFAGGVARVRATSFRFLVNVHAGDRVVAGGRVRAVRRDGAGRQVDCEVWLDVDGGARALSGTATLHL